jgi:hypothetical protein
MDILLSSYFGQADIFIESLPANIVQTSSDICGAKGASNFIKSKIVDIKTTVYYYNGCIRTLFLQYCENKRKNPVIYNFIKNKLFDKNVLGIINSF